MDRDDCIRLVEQKYFGNVMKGDIEAILECFTEDAHIRIRHGDAPEREFSLKSGGDGPSAREFYQHLCSNFSSHFGGFKHFIDVESGRSAATFLVTLTPRPDSPYASDGPQTLHNCNFFEYRSGRIADMIIYYSNPSANVSDPQAPTGYPSTD